METLTICTNVSPIVLRLDVYSKLAFKVFQNVYRSNVVHQQLAHYTTCCDTRKNEMKCNALKSRNYQLIVRLLIISRKYESTDLMCGNENILGSESHLDIDFRAGDVWCHYP